MRLSQPATPTSRGAFTLVELLVVIAIIGMLVALLLPAVQAARKSARKTECLNNIKQIATGMINYHTSKQKFPGYVQPLRRNNGDYLVINSANGVSGSELVGVAEADQNQSWVSWAGVIAPELERQDIYDNMVDGEVVSPQPRALVVPLETLICPEDTELSSLPGAAGMTYVVNTGAWDFNGTLSPDDWIQPTSSMGDTKDNGVFHNLALGNLQTTLSGVRDGASTTLMASENVHKETDDYSWLGVLNTQFGEQQLGFVWTLDVNLNPAALATSDPQFQYPISVEDELPYDISVPKYARPASGHSAGAVNVAYVDGHGGSLSADIDYTVYQRLMTPNGRECVDPTDHSIQTTTGQLRALAPLSEDDF